MAYSSRENLEMMNSVGGVPYIPFKKNATDTQGDSAMWITMHHYSSSTGMGSWSTFIRGVILSL
jgi:hypothetical protein